MPKAATVKKKPTLSKNQEQEKKLSAGIDKILETHGVEQHFDAPLNKKFRDGKIYLLLTSGGVKQEGFGQTGKMCKDGFDAVNSFLKELTILLDDNPEATQIHWRQKGALIERSKNVSGYEGKWVCKVRARLYLE